MLKLLDPSVHDKYRATIDSFLELLKHHQNIVLPSELCDKATFFIDTPKNGSPSAQKAGGEIYGGAVFYPQKISSKVELLPTDQPEEMLGKLFSAYKPNGKTYWIARVGIFQDHDLSTPLVEKLERRHQFYQQLYKAFLKFGKTKKVKLLAFTLRNYDTFDINTYKYWPSLLEVKHPGAFDGCFYGLLALKKRPHAPRKHENISLIFQPFAETGRSLDPSHVQGETL